MNVADEWEETFADFGEDENGRPLDCTVQTLIRRGQMGDQWATPKSIPGLPQHPQNRLVRNSDGNEVLSSSRLYAPIRHREAFRLGSKVTLDDGTESVVLSLLTHRNSATFAFIEVNLE